MIPKGIIAKPQSQIPNTVYMYLRKEEKKSREHLCSSNMEIAEILYFTQIQFENVVFPMMTAEWLHLASNVQNLIIQMRTW
jgi:hypothetical protein